MTALLSLTMLVGALTVEPDRQGSDQNKLRALFRTVRGDLVFEFDVSLAPNTVNKLCELIAYGIYDGTHFHRVEPGFVIQLSTAENRLSPLNADQTSRIQKLRAEWTSTRHRKGTLSMARMDNDPHSGTTSFSILLGDAPHLDGKYTVVGEMTHGWDVLDLFLKVPRNGSAPTERLTVIEAKLLRPGEPLPTLEVGNLNPNVSGGSLASAKSTVPVDVSMVASVAVGVVILIGVIHALLNGWVSPARLRSINLLGIFVGALLLMILATPVAHHFPPVGLLLFVGLLGLFKLMGSFETAS